MENFPFNVPPSAEQVPQKIEERVKEIKENTPANMLPEIVTELKEYIKLRTLNEVPYEDLPDDLREEIGTRDPQDEFQERIEEFDPWFEMMDTYGYDPDKKEERWSLEELKQLVKQLK